MSVARRLGPLLLVLVLAAGTLLAPLHFTEHRAFWRRVLDASHVPFFAALTFFLHWLNPLGLVLPRQRVGGAAGLALLAVIATEIIQPLLGREESFTDFRNGFGGIVIAFLALRWAPRFAGPRLLVWIGMALAISGLAVRAPWRELRGLWWRHTHFPMLADFEQEEQMRLWNDGVGTERGARNPFIHRSTGVAAHGRFALKIFAASRASPSHWLAQDRADWQGFDAFAFEVFNPGAPCRLGLRIDDDGPLRSARDRFYTELRIAGGWNHLRIPLSAIAHSPQQRELNLRAITRVAFKVYPEGTAPATCHLDSLRLERQ